MLHGEEGGICLVQTPVQGMIPANPSETVIRHIHEGQENKRERKGVKKYL